MSAERPHRPWLPRFIDLGEDQIVGLPRAIRRSSSPTHGANLKESAIAPSFPPQSGSDSPFRLPHVQSLPHKCAACNGVLDGACHVFYGLRFHPACLKCKSCARPLSPPSGVVSRGGFYCESCLSLRQARHCPVCRLPITPGDEIIRPLGLADAIHASCFHCFECGTRLAAGDGKLVGRVYLCSACEGKCPICAKCQKPIVGRSIKALHRFYHPGHFQCYVCLTRLEEGRYVIHHNRAYCPLDGRPFVHSCAFCHKVFEPNAQKQMWRGKPYHLRCFVCHVCSRPLLDEVAEFHNRPYCLDCHRKRMPFAILAVRAHSPAVTEAIRTKIGQLSGKEFTRPMYRKNIDEVEYIETPRVGVLLASRQRKMRTMQGKAQNPLKVRHRHRSEHHLPGELRHHTVHHKGGKREVLAFRDTPDGEPVQKQPDKEAFEEVSMDDEEHGET